MNRTAFQSTSRRDGGYVFVAMMALVAALLGTGAAFMQWATDERAQNKRAEASMQAYYLAQTGVIEKGLNWLDQQQLSLLPGSQIALGGGEVPDVGHYRNVVIDRPFGGVEDPNNFSFTDMYRISAIGEVVIPWNLEDEDTDTVERKAVLYVQVRSFVDYMYLTDNETSLSFPGDIIRFWGCDTLWGRTHSNDWIATMSGGCGANLPVFYDIVSTTKPTFRPGSPNPAGVFRGGPPLFNAAPVLLPELANPVRDGASEQGRFWSFPGEEWRCEIDGATATFYHYEEGTEFDPNEAESMTVNCAASPKPCVFIDGKLDLKGVMSMNNCGITIGCSEDIRLIDNIMLEGTNQVSGALPAGALGPTGSVIGIVGEQWVYIANTWENGRENQSQGSDIVITAAIVALGMSFQLEQMNDIGDNYICPTPPAQDERGEIVMTGSVTQRYRGYVHRSNHNGTGYNKVYHYDSRFRTRRPPCFLKATDDEGRALFNITQWGQASEDPVDVARGVRVRYN